MNRDDKLLDFRFSDSLVQQAMLYPEQVLGRVIAQHKNLYRVVTARSEVFAEVSGRFRYASNRGSDYPTVGDFVMIDRDDEPSGNAIIHRILPRKSVFVRKAAGTSYDTQTVAANIDTVFICMSLNNDFNLRRLERYLSIAWDSGATPVVVLTKSDLSYNLDTQLSDIKKTAIGADVVVTSSMTEDGYKTILQHIRPGETVAFMGSSGVGKSTLINRLLGENIITTKEIRKDDKGKHATTRRELITVPGGGAVIDTPGMRELGVESANLTKAFSDITEFADKCRFRDCQHQDEPGCAVKEAIEGGEIDEDRLASYTKLKKEARYEGLTSKQIDQAKMDDMYASFGGSKNARDYVKSKRRKI